MTLPRMLTRALWTKHGDKSLPLGFPLGGVGFELASEPQDRNHGTQHNGRLRRERSSRCRLGHLAATAPLGLPTR